MQRGQSRAEKNKRNWQEKYGSGGELLLLKHLLFGMHMRMGKIIYQSANPFAHTEEKDLTMAMASGRFSYGNNFTVNCTK